MQQCSPAVFEDAVSVGWQLVGGANPEGEQDPAILLTEPWGGGHSERRQHSAGGAMYTGSGMLYTELQCIYIAWPSLAQINNNYCNEVL